jgi:hypothetical protein
VKKAAVRVRKPLKKGKGKVDTKARYNSPVVLEEEAETKERTSPYGKKKR